MEYSVKTHIDANVVFHISMKFGFASHHEYFRPTSTLPFESVASSFGVGNYVTLVKFVYFMPVSILLYSFLLKCVCIETQRKCDHRAEKLSIVLFADPSPCIAIASHKIGKTE